MLLLYRFSLFAILNGVGVLSLRDGESEVIVMKVGFAIIIQKNRLR